jgi:hypothetical protein
LAVAAQRFCSLDLYALDRLPVSVVSAILSDPQVAITSESWLCGWILAHPPDSEHYCLLEHVKFAHVHGEAASAVEEKFPRLVGFLNSAVVDAVSQRLRLPIAPFPDSSRWAPALRKQEDVPFHFGHKLRGIVHMLARECGRNPAEASEISVTASSVGEPRDRFAPENIADVAGGGFFRSAPDSHTNPWVAYDFIDKRIYPTYVTVLPRLDAGSGRPHQWIVEGSLDGQNWIELVRNAGEWSGKEASIQARTIGGGPFRFFRFVQCGPDSRNLPILSLIALELFGKVEWLGGPD